MKRKSLFLVILFMVVSVVSFSAKAYGVNNDVGFTVKAIIPKNQIDKQMSYFDLKMVPEQKQQLALEVRNKSQKEMKVSVKAISASTNKNGVIDYQTENIKDKTLKTPFSDIATVKTPELTIKGNSSATAIIDVTMPKEEYDGIILGGILITKAIDEKDASDEENSVQINNEYSYAVGVKLTETDEVILPDFKGIKAEATLDNSYIVVDHYIRNETAAIAKNIDISVKIYNSNNILIKTKEETINMAPNSFMKYAVKWEDKIKPGKYESRVVMKMGDDEWKFKLPFEVKEDVAKDLNDNSLDENVTIPFWLVMVILLFIILAGTIVFLLYKLKKQKDK